MDRVGGRGGSPLSSFEVCKDLENMGTRFASRPAPLKGCGEFTGCRLCRRPLDLDASMLGWLSASGWLLAVCCWLAGCLPGWLHYCSRFYRIGGCLDHLSVSLLDPGHTLGSSGGPSDYMVSAFAVRRRFLVCLFCLETRSTISHPN